MLHRLLFLALMLGACSPGEAPLPNQAETPNQAEAAPPPPAPLPENVVEGQADFGVALYRQLAAKSGNLFLSPASISAALGMVHAGAEGETAVEMTRALRYPDDPGLHASLGALLRRLPIEAEGRVVRIGNALWVQKDFALRPDYTALVRRDYGGEASPVDFIGAPDAAIATINAWAEEKTAGRIKGLLKRENIDVDTRLILTNSIYFKGDWLRPFQASQTRSRPFQLAAGGTVSAPFMRQRGPFRMIEQEGFKALEAPYKGEELSMILFVPERADGLAAFERGLTGETLNRWIDALRAEQAGDTEVVIPKLQMTTRASLVPELKALGMRRAFTPAAELRGIAEADLRLSDVIHQTFLLVDEKGTEAAAVTGAIAEIVSMPRQFHADRPFFFVIRDNRSGTILFMGRIQSPPGGA